MGCAASTDRVERRRRGRALGHCEASTSGLLVARHQNGQQESVSVSVAAAAGRRRGCKVAPEPKEEEQAAALAMPGSPSFRFYCQKAAAVDALVAAADTDGGDRDSDGSVRITETPQAIKKNGLAHNASDLSKSKDVNRWLKFRGLAIVAAAVYSLFSRHSAPPAAAKSHHPCAASAPVAAAAISHP